jgi:hypothetical protein
LQRTHTPRPYCISALVGMPLKGTVAVFSIGVNDIRPSSNNFMTGHELSLPSTDDAFASPSPPTKHGIDRFPKIRTLGNGLHFCPWLSICVRFGPISSRQPGGCMPQMLSYDGPRMDENEATTHYGPLCSSHSNKMLELYIKIATATVNISQGHSKPAIP